LDADCELFLDDDFMQISVTSYLEQRKVFESEEDVFDLQ
jgi:hypothetical protein